MERSPQDTTHYDILEVSIHALPAEIKQAYRRLARKYHPDVNPDNPEAVEIFQRISQSYGVLSDPTARARYDQRIGVNTVDQGDTDSSTNSDADSKTGSRSTTYRATDRASTSQGRSPASYSPDSYSYQTPAELCQAGFRQTQFKRYERAIELFSAALKQQPSFAKAYAHRGYAYERLDQDSAALADYAEAIRLDETLAIAHYFRGLTRFKLGYSEAAIEDYSTALELNPDNAQALYRRGLAYADIDEMDIAQTDLKRATRLFQAEGDRMMQLEVEAVYRRLTRPQSWRGWLDGLTSLLLALWNTVLITLLNPIECGFAAYRHYRPRMAIAIGLILAAAYVICFSVGLKLLLTLTLQSNSFSVVRAISLGLLPFAGVTGLYTLTRSTLGGSGRFAGDVFASGISLIPASAAMLLIPVFSGTASLMIGAIALSYTTLLLYGGCTHMSNLAPGRSAFITTVMLIVRLIPFLLVMN